MRLPRTSYGYLAPSGARARGWACRNDGCRVGDDVPPTRWPAACPECGGRVDPTFEEPWAHDARRLELRHDLAGGNEYERSVAEVELQVWAYEDAWRRGDRAAAANAWSEFRRIRDREGPYGFWIGAGHRQLVASAVRHGDVDEAFREVLEQYPGIDTSNVEDDNTTRTQARGFVSSCIEVLGSAASVGHPLEAELDHKMRDVAQRIEGVMMSDAWRGMQRAADLRAFHRSGLAIAALRWSDATVHDDLPSFAGAWASMNDAVRSLRIHDDPGPIDTLLERIGPTPLGRLLRAHRRVAVGDLRGAVSDLDAVLTSTDASARQFSWQAYATKGVLVARMTPGDLDEGIALCRRGRRQRSRPWRPVTDADTTLARLLLWRAQRAGTSTSAAQRAADTAEAVRLTRRRSRSKPCGLEDLLLRQEAKAAAVAVAADRGDAERTHPERTHAEWGKLLAGPWSAAEKARAAAAWVQWALGTEDKAMAAEAYQRLVVLVAEDCSERYTVTAKQRVLAVAQEYAEEAGYWLARSGRYREAVLALEAGRAVGLSETLGRESVAVVETLRSAGRDDLATAFGRAADRYEELSRESAPDLRQAWDDLRAVAEQIKTVVGTDPLRPEIGYADVTAQTGEGAVVYLAAAKAGGYALVVAAKHDPQFIDIPRLDRAAVSALIGKVMPGAGTRSQDHDTRAEPRLGTPDTEVSGARDAWLSGSAADPVMSSLRALWTSGVRDLLLLSARGRVVTFIPVGLLGLLPLHAAGELATVPDSEHFMSHSGYFSAIRYAPNVRTLRRCRDTARGLAGRDASLVAVDVPDGHGLRPEAHLNYVAQETEEAVRAWKGEAARSIHGCTWEEFRNAADDRTVWHLACHASSNPRSIMETRLYFADQSVTLDVLRRSLRPSRRRLAVLSACETNITDSSIPNELVGLPSALIQIGFAGVVAAAWKVDDLATAYLMTEFYRLWCEEGVEPVVALNGAQVWLRSATRGQLKAALPNLEPGGGPAEAPYRHPRYWAAFAYTGA
jgi:hypothetical protein